MRSKRSFEEAGAAKFLQLVSAPATAPYGRLGFVIGSKALPRAVDRNRVRRMLRVVLREWCPDTHGVDLIVRLKRPVARSEFSRVVAEARRMLSFLE